MTTTKSVPIPAVVRMREEAKILNRVLKAVATLPDAQSRSECLRRATMAVQDEVDEDAAPPVVW